MVVGPGRIAGYAMAGFGLLGCLSALANLVTYGAGFYGWVSASVIAATGLVLVSSYEGITVEQTRYRNYTWILGVRSGEWRRMPQVIRITITPFKSSYTVSDAIAPSITVNTHGNYRVLLSIQDSPVGIIAAISPAAQAQAQAELLSQLLEVPVLQPVA